MPLKNVIFKNLEFVYCVTFCNSAFEQGNLDLWCNIDTFMGIKYHTLFKSVCNYNYVVKEYFVTGNLSGECNNCINNEQSHF